MKSRILMTYETIVSKIFPAGAGWQTGMIIATNNVYTPIGSCICTGAAEVTGVALGHTLYTGVKSIYKNKPWNPKKELGTATLLGSASFIPGAILQPVMDSSKFLAENTKYLLSEEISQLHENINILPDELEFYSVVGTTGIVCGSAFYLGLRIYRRLLSSSILNSLITVDKASKENGKHDRQLCLSLMGATGAFVVTNPALLGIIAKPLVIHPGTYDLTAIVIAGTSTALGFSGIQSIQNLLVRRGRSWVD